MITLLKFNLVQDFEKKKAEPKTPHFLCLSQDMVAGSQKRKCGLKYVILTSGRAMRTLPLVGKTGVLPFFLLYNSQAFPALIIAP